MFGFDHVAFGVKLPPIILGFRHVGTHLCNVKIVSQSPDLITSWNQLLHTGRILIF